MALVTNKKGEAVTVCPKCGYEEFYVSVRMSGRGQYMMRLDGGQGDNTQLHDCLKYTLGIIATCANCNKRLGKFEEDNNDSSAK